MCKINWEERVFQLASNLYASNEMITIDQAIAEALRFKETYIELMGLEEKKEEELAPKTKATKDEGDDNFVEMIYSLYPTKCPKRGSSLGKSTKDKNRIRKLLKTYTKEQIEAVVRKEVEDKYGKAYMQNFSTFLNNFPDPSIMEDHSKEHSKKEKELVINGVIYK